MAEQDFSQRDYKNPAFLYKSDMIFKRLTRLNFLPKFDNKNSAFLTKGAKKKND